MVFASASYPWGSPCDTSFSPVLVGQQFKTFNGDWAAFTLAFFGFLRCSEFTYQGVHKCCSRFDLDAGCVVFSQSGFPTTASCYTSFLCSSKTDSFRLGQSLIIARSSFPICAVTAMQHYFQLAASPPGSLFSFQYSRLLTRSAVFPCYGILRVLQGFLFITLKVTVSHWYRLYSRCCGPARLAD